MTGPRQGRQSLRPMQWVALLLSAPVSAAIVLADQASAQMQKAPETPKEQVRSDVSTRQIQIQSNFTGIQIVIFGAVDNAINTPGTAPYDVVAVIKGPDQNYMVRRKRRVAGIWINGPSQVIDKVPGFYAILSTRPLRAIASEDELRKLKVGFSALGLDPRDNATVSNDPFRQALIRRKQERHLFQDLDNGISFVGRSLFRGSVDLPVNVPVGVYQTQVFLFRAGELLSHDDNTLEVQKVGFERQVYLLAYNYPMLYGLIGVLIALFAGLGAWAIFRRE